MIARFPRSISARTGCASLRGEVEVKIVNESNHLKEDDMIIMPANKPHTLKALTKFKIMFVMIKAD